MAKITEHKVDKIGSLFLNLAAVIIITLFSIAAQARHTHYFVWAGMVSFFWGLATYDRAPGAYRNPRIAGLSYVLYGAVLSATIAFITMVFREPERFADYLIQIP